jgi:hypothetical protein
MLPVWYSVDEIPYDQMWQDAIHWLPRILEGELIEITIAFREDDESVAKVIY